MRRADHRLESSHLGRQDRSAEARRQHRRHGLHTAARSCERRRRAIQTATSPTHVVHGGYGVWRGFWWVRVAVRLHGVAWAARRRHLSQHPPLRSHPPIGDERAHWARRPDDVGAMAP